MNAFVCRGVNCPELLSYHYLPGDIMGIMKLLLANLLRLNKFTCIRWLGQDELLDIKSVYKGV